MAKQRQWTWAPDRRLKPTVPEDAEKAPLGQYASPGPNAMSPTFTRLRHTGKWWEVDRGLTLETIRDKGIYHPPG